MGKILVFVLLGSFFFVSLGANGDWATIDPTQFSLRPPPAEGSVQYQNDFATLHQYQEERSDADCRLAGKQLFPSFSVFYEVAESPLTKSETNQTRQVIDKVIKATMRVASYFKKTYERPRPYDVDETLRPCIKKPGGSSAYPSSHAAAATASGCVLAERFPEKAKALQLYGKLLGDLRVTVGVHHPTDVIAGQSLGKAICETLLADPEFQAEW